jgi:uncharacterized protein with PhoU and TrkA domain
MEKRRAMRILIIKRGEKKYRDGPENMAIMAILT